MRRQTLQYQDDCRVRQERPDLSGDYLVTNRWISPEARDRVPGIQKERRAGKKRRLPDIVPANEHSWELAIAVLGVALLGVLVYRYDWKLGDATGVAGFAVLVLTAIVKYLRHQSIPLAIYSAIKWVLVTVGVAIVAAGVIAFYSVQALLSQLQSTPEAHQAAVTDLGRVQIAIAALIFFAVAVSTYATWKFYSLRYSESRLGALKDALI